MRPPRFEVRGLRIVAAAVAILAFGGSAAAVARAQTVAPDQASATLPANETESGIPPETPVSVAAAVPTAAPKRAPRRRFEHVEITPVLQYTISTGSDVIPRNGPYPNTLPFDLLQITGDVRYRFNGHSGLQYQRISHTGAAGRTLRGGRPNYGGSGYDYEDRLWATWQFNPALSYRAGYHYRARVCCPGAGDPNGIPRFLGGFLTDLSYRFGPNTIGGKPFSTSLRYEQNYHRFIAAAQKSLVRGDYDSGQKPTFAYTLYSNIYVGHQTKFVPYYGIEYFSTYFSNNPHMSVTYRKVYGAAYRAGAINYRFYVKIDQPNGLAAGPDASHKSTAFLEAGFRYHR